MSFTNIFATGTSFTLFMKTFPFWIIIALCLFAFLTFIYYKSCTKRNKPINFLIIFILFIFNFAMCTSIWYFSWGRFPSTLDKAKTLLDKGVEKWKNRPKREPKPSISGGIISKFPKGNKQQQKPVDIAPLFTKIDDTLKEMAKIRKQYKNEQDKLEKKLEEKQDELKEIIAEQELNASIKKQIETAMKENTKAINALLTEKDELEIEKLNAKAQLAIINNEITLKEAKKQQLEKIRKAKQEIRDKMSDGKDKDEINAQISELDKEIQKHQEEINKLSDEVVGLKRKIEQIEGKITALNNKITNLNIIYKDYFASMEAINNKSTNEKNEIEKQKQERTTLELKKGDKQRALETLRQDIISKETHITGLKKLINNKDTSEAKKEEYKKQIETIKEEIVKLEAKNAPQVQQLETEIKAIEKDIQEKDKFLESKKSEAEKQQKDLKDKINAVQEADRKLKAKMMAVELLKSELVVSIIENPQSYINFGLGEMNVQSAVEKLIATIDVGEMAKGLIDSVWQGDERLKDKQLERKEREDRNELEKTKRTERKQKFITNRLKLGEEFAFFYNRLYDDDYNPRPLNQHQVDELKTFLDNIVKNEKQNYESIKVEGEKAKNAIDEKTQEKAKLKAGTELENEKLEFNKVIDAIRKEIADLQAELLKLPPDKRNLSLSRIKNKQALILRNEAIKSQLQGDFITAKNANESADNLEKEAKRLIKEIKDETYTLVENYQTQNS